MTPAATGAALHRRGDRAAAPVQPTATSTAAAGVAGAPLRRPAAPSSRSPDHLRVVAPRHRTPADQPRRLLLATGVIVISAVAFGLVYLHVVLAQRQFALDDLTTRVTHQQEQYQQLRLQVAQLESPTRIIAVAEGRLGMREPSSVTYLTPSGPGGPPPTAGPAAAASPAPSASAAYANPRDAAPPGDADWPKIKSLLAGRP